MGVGLGNQAAMVGILEAEFASGLAVMGNQVASSGMASALAAAAFESSLIVTVATGVVVLAGVLIVVGVASAIWKRWNYVQVRNIDSYEEVLDLAIREAKAWKSPQKSDEATMPMEQEINKEHELKCQGFNLVKPYPFQSDVV
jgi:hypothetical protein